MTIIFCCIRDTFLARRGCVYKWSNNLGYFIVAIFLFLDIYQNVSSIDWLMINSFNFSIFLFLDNLKDLRYRQLFNLSYRLGMSMSMKIDCLNAPTKKMQFIHSQALSGYMIFLIAVKYANLLHFLFITVKFHQHVHLLIPCCLWSKGSKSFLYFA